MYKFLLVLVFSILAFPAYGQTFDGRCEAPQQEQPAEQPKPFRYSSSIDFTKTQNSMASACAPYMDMKQTIEEEFKEDKQVQAMVANGAVLEVYVDKDGSWSMILVSPRGLACMIASGSNWEQFKKADGI